MSKVFPLSESGVRYRVQSEAAPGGGILYVQEHEDGYTSVEWPSFYSCKSFLEIATEILGDLVDEERSEALVIGQKIGVLQLYGAQVREFLNSGQYANMIRVDVKGSNLAMLSYSRIGHVIQVCFTCQPLPFEPVRKLIRATAKSSLAETVDSVLSTLGLEPAV